MSAKALAVAVTAFVFGLIGGAVYALDHGSFNTPTMVAVAVVSLGISACALPFFRD